MLNVLINSLVRSLARVIFSKNPLWLIIIILILLVTYQKLYAYEYEYKGVYPVQGIITNYCDDCFLQLPPEFLQSNVVMSVNSDKKKDFENALIKASKAIGWDLKKRGREFIAEPVQNEGNLTYISCLNDEPVNVPKYLFSFSVRSDSIKCAKRDSLALFEVQRQDSITRYKDSLESVFLDYSRYELRYYSYSKSFTDKIGVSFQEMLMSGNLRKKFHVYDDWAFFATENNDTTFNFRKINVSLDSSVNLDWGTEEQTLLNSYVNEGVTNNNYEWRKYGLIVKIVKDNRKIKLEYIFRDKENSVSVLQGSASGELKDTIMVYGQYNSSRQVSKGIPILSSIPLIKYLFAVNQTINDLRNFELYLIPSVPFPDPNSLNPKEKENEKD